MCHEGLCPAAFSSRPGTGSGCRIALAPRDTDRVIRSSRREVFCQSPAGLKPCFERVWQSTGHRDRWAIAHAGAAGRSRRSAGSIRAGATVLIVAFPCSERPPERPVSAARSLTGSMGGEDTAPLVDGISMPQRVFRHEQAACLVGAIAVALDSRVGRDQHQGLRRDRDMLVR